MDREARAHNAAVEAANEELLQGWKDTTDLSWRVHQVLLGTTAWTSYGDIADIAQCAPNTAKKYLDRLVELGIARSDVGRYMRNEAYAEWHEAYRLYENASSEELLARVQQLDTKRKVYRTRFGCDRPSDASTADDGDSIGEHLIALDEWRQIERDSRLYELAWTMKQNNGHLLPRGVAGRVDERDGLPEPPNNFSVTSRPPESDDE